ncbi:alpha/beta hydrolase [Aurantiacibacter sp. D1-12]|uniref:alpha/beta hydrolase n=1 Tax=Aurantiacibacter sp. D1-12 TaxID=2993658 RepID=UPI00237CBE9D|nr:alpha/beta hydrolase [Aurantiacibacter sp. D1-12]MDE1467796.1 alpha/beta hydrolase [Aurantiacibacter sp. D1-12]
MGAMKFILAPIALAALAAGIAFSVDRLRTFNALVPKDGNSAQIATGIAYGTNERQMLDIYAPVEAPDVALPVIVWFYGGSWNSGTRHGYDFAGRALAAQNYIVVVPDYRLVPEVRFPGFVEDGAEAMRWVRANIAERGGDPDNIVVMGHSAGAHLAAMLAADPQWLGEDRAAIKGLIGLAGPYDFLPLDTSSTIEAFGQWPQLEETQPITYADASSPPALLLTGAEDTTVKPRNSVSLAAHLTEAGVDAEVTQYEGVDHIDILIAMARPLRGRAPVLEDAIAFADEVTRPES